jgi:hypothetical protein
MTGAKKPVPGKSTKETVKTIVQGMPVDAVYPWLLLTPVLFYCTGGHGCNAHPAFPAPSFSGVDYLKSSDISCREIMDSCLPSVVMPREGGHPVHAGLSVQSPLSLEYWIARQAGL